MYDLEGLSGTVSTECRPKWYVSSPHKVRVVCGEAPRDEPYGVRHARQVGAAFTECGEPALSWAIFWETPFHDEMELVCQACVNSLVQHRYGAQPATSGSVA